MTDKTMFTELDQYQWFNQIDDLADASNLDLSTRCLADIPPAPLSLVLTIMQEIVTRPEVVAAWSSAPLDGQIGPEESFLLRWYNDYLDYKYGNETMAVDEATSHMRLLVNGVYSGVDDPKLRAALLADIDVYDDGVTSA
uniref:hypothetical protein n=1 Tax=Pararhizobium sp. IMCC3301 TaxID=3067904 RepID=UPI002740E132|nr:hypothetical protein [Pararhizobium sp. IMCC3301]